MKIRLLKIMIVNLKNKNMSSKRNKKYDDSNSVSKSNKMFICDKFTVMHTNIQSVNGRLGPLEAAVKALDVDMGTINETNLKGNKKFEVDGYMTNNQNKTRGTKG